MKCEVFYTKFPVFCRSVREIFFPHEGKIKTSRGKIEMVV